MARQVLAIPELLSLILKATPPKDQVAAAVVCQAWNEQAVRVIWMERPTLDHSFTRASQIDAEEQAEVLDFVNRDIPVASDLKTGRD
ncbi:hypothetical protein FRC02_001646 [Tulasnella sp. 418]|nr:hypothetical protein FRC02_001646 [Tulasnella sp. 418]